MANYTSKANGNLSTTGAVVWNEAGRPTTDDYITSLAHNIADDVSVQLGNDSGAAIVSAACYPAINTFTVNAGITLTLQGDFQAAALSVYKLILEAGSTWKFDPASGVSLKFDWGSFGYLICNGSTGSHVTVTTDKSRGGLNSTMNLSAKVGLQLATYADFVNFGTTSTFGVQTIGYSFDPTYDFDISITDTTLTNCNYSFTGDSSFDDDYTFSGNVFSGSVPITVGGISNRCAAFAFAGAGSTGTWLIDGNGFDLGLHFTNFRSRIAFTNNVLPSLFNADGAWSSDTKFSGNVVYTSDGEGLSTMFGPSKNCFLYRVAALNPHFMTTVAGGNVTGWVFEATGDNGDIVFPPATGALSVTGCLVLPNDAGNSSGDLLSCLSPSAGLAVTMNHNTCCMKNVENGAFGMDETGGSVIGQAPAVRSNLLWSDTAAAGAGAKAINSLAPTTNAVDSVTLATHNAFLNPFIGTCRYDSSGTESTQADVVGYQGLRISRDEAYPNAQVGANDLTLTGTPAQLFVDVDYDWLAWGAENGVSGDTDDVFAYMVANPAIATAPTTGIVDKCKAAFAVTGSQGLLLQGAGHDNETIGMGEYVAPASGGTYRMDNRLMRPRRY